MKSFLNKYIKHITLFFIALGFLIGIVFKEGFSYFVIISSMSLPFGITYLIINKLYYKFIFISWALPLPLFAIQMLDDIFNIEKHLFLIIGISLLLIALSLFFLFKMIKRIQNIKEQNRAIRDTLYSAVFTAICYILIVVLFYAYNLDFK